MAAGRAPGKPGGKRRAGLPPGSPAAYLEAMRFGWLVPCSFSFPGPPGRCPGA